jgi:streptomycin 6-kinase
MKISIPASLAQNVKTTHGADGLNWLSKLPVIVAELCSLWRLEVAAQFDDLTYSFVAHVIRQDETSAVLKVAPHAKAMSRQAHALEVFNGVGAARLFANDEPHGALLLEKLSRPSKVDADSFCEAASKLTIERNSSLSKSFTHVSVWGLGFEKFMRTQNGDALKAREVGLTDSLVLKADQIFKKLISTTKQETLLHGDLHHANLLQRQSGEWVAIDPKGVWGDPCYEAGAFLRNSGSPSDDQIKKISKQLGFDETRVSEWAYAQAVLAAIWSVGDGSEQVKSWLLAATKLSSNI